MILYLDTSALVKLFVSERGSKPVHQLAAEAEAVVTSRVAYVEACAAFARRRKEGRLSKREYQAVRRALRAQWSQFGVVELDELKAGELSTHYGLRAFGAVHLAAALEVRSQIGEVVVEFCSFDARQVVAARSEKFSVVPSR